jgi:hypothetical protein
MGKLLVLLLIVSCFSAAANNRNKLIKNKGVWTTTDKSIWSLNRVPANGDTIVVEAKDTLVIQQDLKSLSSETIILQVYGTLFFDGSAAKLSLSSTSTIILYTGATVISTGSPSQLIELGKQDVYKGDLGTIVGPATATSAYNGFLPILEAPIIPLPVKYLGFSAVRKNTDVLVQWATSQEIGADFYEVERSEDGSNWKAISKIQAAGTTNSISNYTYTDKNISARTVYYRIKQVDLNGRFEYSAIRAVKADSNNNVVKATTAHGNIVLQFSKQATGQVEVRLVSFNGQVVSRQLLNRPVGQLVIPAKVKGNYILTISDQQDIQVNTQILL